MLGQIADRPVGHPYVLLVEDDNEIRESVRELLEFEGFNVQEAVNGLEALKHLRTESELPRLILLDMMMPVMDGWAFIEQRNTDAALAQIPVVIVSAVADRSQLPPTEHHLRKPLDVVQLLTIVGAYFH